MSYDHEAQQSLNKQALALPQPGDYWQEMFCPYFLVVAVNPKQDQYTVLSCMGGPKSYSRKEEINARIDNKDNTWSFDYSKHMVVDRAWIEKAVKYGSIDGFVADVMRSGEKSTLIVKEWKRFHTQRLLKELKELGPEVSQMILQAEW
jgi:hypothetical protein